MARLILAGCLVACLAGGCARGGALDILELNFKRIPEAGPLAERVPLGEGYWWVRDDAVCLALHDDQRGLGGDLDHRWADFSFVLPGMPASGARDYHLGSISFRGYRHVGANHSRYTSSQGILGLWVENRGEVRGRFRLIATKEIFHILTGWSRVGSVVITGAFRALQNPTRGTMILQRSEEGMKRGGKLNTSSEGARPRARRVEGPPVGQNKRSNDRGRDAKPPD